MTSASRWAVVWAAFFVVPLVMFGGRLGRVGGALMTLVYLLYITLSA